MIDEVKLTKNDIQEYEGIIFDQYTGRAEREDLILLLLENQKTPHDLKKQLREYANKLDIIYARFFETFAPVSHVGFKHKKGPLVLNDIHAHIIPTTLKSR